LEATEHCHAAAAATCCHLQVKTRGKKKKARVAKGTTQEEFEDVMQVLVQTAKEQLGDLGIKDVRFQYDNNRIQAGARLERMGMDKASKLKLPKYSPDMNKPIEHVFSPLKSNIMKQLRKLEAKQLTAEKAQSIAIKCFSDLKKESIQRDIKSLPLTWQAIAADKGSSVDSGKRRLYFGTAGGYPVAKLR
jgi:transposase